MGNFLNYSKTVGLFFTVESYSLYGENFAVMPYKSLVCALEFYLV